MKLWVISQNLCDDYDTYDSAVVAARSPSDARKIHPCGRWPGHGWVETKDVHVRYIGEAAESTKRGVILASFNAG